MSFTTNHIVSVTTAALIAGASALAGAISTMPPDAPFEAIGAQTWMMALLAFVLAGAKDAQSRFAEPPAGKVDV